MIYFLKHGQCEGKSLASPSMSLAHQVSAFQKRCDGHSLYGERLTKAHFPHSLDQWKFQAETFETSSHESSNSSAQRAIKTLQTVECAKLSRVGHPWIEIVSESWITQEEACRLGWEVPGEVPGGTCRFLFLPGEKRRLLNEIHIANNDDKAYCGRIER